MNLCERVIDVTMPKDWESLGIKNELYEDIEERLKRKIEHDFIQFFGIDIQESIRMADEWKLSSYIPKDIEEVQALMKDSFPLAGKIIVEQQRTEAWMYYCNHSYTKQKKVFQALQTIQEMNGIPHI